MNLNVDFAYTPVGDLITFMICLMLVVALFESYTYNTRSFKIFMTALVVTAVSAISNVIFYAIYNVQGDVWSTYLFGGMYCVGLVIVLESFIIYVHDLIELNNKKHLMYTILFNTTLLVVDGVLRFKGVYDVEDFFTIPYMMIYVSCVVYCIGLLICYRERMIRQVYVGLIVSALFAVIVIYKEFEHQNHSFSTATFLFPIVMVMFLAHSNPYNMGTGALNLESFQYYLQKDEKDTLICLKFYKNELAILPKEIEIIMRNFWVKKFRHAKLFNPLPNMYILAVHDEKAIDTMRELFQTKFQEYYEKYHIDYKILVFPKIENFKSVRDVNETFEHFGENVYMNQFSVFDVNTVEAINRGFEILKHVEDIYNCFDIDDERVVPYFQPVKNLKTGEFDSAESLMRLNLPGMGIVYPNEFIELIETNDYMHQFSMIMLNKACQEIRKLHGMVRITVNFSISELKDIHFLDDFQDIVMLNQIDFNRLGVEFTENMNNSEFSVIKEVVAKLKQLGCVVYLDDFGTGYNNFDRVVGLNMDIIKFDRSLLTMAADDEHGTYMIRAFSDILTEVNMGILYEGVETEEQEALCIESHADYLQGFKFSKPIPAEEYEHFLLFSRTAG